ncbi:hypothetical protein HQ560_19440 [bacterium]|nr:hypothetical protein [bacterium]
MTRKLMLSAWGVLLLTFCVGCQVDPSVYQADRSTPPPPRPKKEPAPAKTAKGDDAIRIMPKGGDVNLQSPSNVAITIEKIGVERRSSTNVSGAFAYDGGRAKVAGGAVARRNGLRVSVAGKDYRASVGASARRSKSTSRDSMFIVVQSGTEGFIQMGEDTYVTRLGYWTPFGYRVLVERAFVGRQLVVRPRILGRGMVEVEIWPRFSSRGKRGAMDVTELSTKVVVRDGQSLVLGGMTSGGDDVGAVLFGVGRKQRTHNMTIILTPKIGGLPLDFRALER